ncbi:hypothetical protein A1O3_00066 [Capronia epimyces CBS 606.96]|uniref:Uncharacterized protein n=1 Tax=Capronia epimyces CBS 606.96 TaxID=1182542 RepID=W9YG57_9EURO|nr:uncharacterized protein A1O3_00066 [Capronia epimyces CBS 606.96]EXJ91518.1 hypothetical protein A1O3_00066 [Capronia epimyces CBS 606.96]
MAQSQVKDSDILVLIAAIQSSIGPIQVSYKPNSPEDQYQYLAKWRVKVDAEKVAKQLGMSLSTIPPKFTAIRKRYNIDIKVVNSGALQRNRPNGSPRKRQAAIGSGVARCVHPRAQLQAHHTVAVADPGEMYARPGVEQASQAP